MPSIRIAHPLALAAVMAFAVPATAEDIVNFGVQPSTQPILVAHGAGFL